MNSLILQLWCEMGLPILKPTPICFTGEKMTIENELQEKLESYRELKEFIKEYNKKQLQKGLDLGVRIIQDLICKYPYQIGCVHIEWDDDYFKENLVVKLGKPFESNGHFKENGATEYILKRYPDAKKHYLGIQVATCISKRNIDKFVNGEIE